MSMRSLLVGFMAVAFGTSAVLGVNLWHKAQGDGNGATVTIVVADKPIPRFTVVTRDLLKTQEYPKDLVPSGSFMNMADVEGRVATSNLLQGEPLVEGRISAKGAGRGMSVVVAPGMRAFTIGTPSISTGVAGFILPGNNVDVLLTLTEGQHEPTGGASTNTLAQNIEILAVDQVIEAPNGNKVDPNQLRSVTLLGTPEQAAQLELGQNRGVLHLALRNPEDTGTATAHVTLKEILAPTRPRREHWEVSEPPLPMPRVVSAPKPEDKQEVAMEVLPYPRVKEAEIALPPIRTLRGVDFSYAGVR